jgi:hypothetical protein
MAAAAAVVAADEGALAQRSWAVVLLPGLWFTDVPVGILPSRWSIFAAAFGRMLSRS